MIKSSKADNTNKASSGKVVLAPNRSLGGSKVSGHLFFLLGVFDAVCKAYGIPYVLANHSAWDAVKYGHYHEKLYDTTVMLERDQFERLLDVSFPAENHKIVPEDESKEGLTARFIDTNSVLIDYRNPERYAQPAVGIGIVVAQVDGEVARVKNVKGKTVEMPAELFEDIVSVVFQGSEFPLFADIDAYFAAVATADWRNHMWPYRIPDDCLELVYCGYVPYERFMKQRVVKKSLSSRRRKLRAKYKDWLDEKYEPARQETIREELYLQRTSDRFALWEKYYPQKQELFELAEAAKREAEEAAGWEAAADAQEARAQEAAETEAAVGCGIGAAAVTGEPEARQAEEPAGLPLDREAQRQVPSASRAFVGAGAAAAGGFAGASRFAGAAYGEDPEADAEKAGDDEGVEQMPGISDDIGTEEELEPLALLDGSGAADGSAARMNPQSVGGNVGGGTLGTEALEAAEEPAEEPVELSSAEELELRLKPFLSKVEYYYKKGLGFSFDEDVLQLALPILRKRHGDGYVEKLLKMMPEEYRTESVEDILRANGVDHPLLRDGQTAGPTDSRAVAGPVDQGGESLES